MRKSSAGFLVGLYREMLRIRLCEEGFVEPILTGEVRCPVHLYSGEEAIAVGVCAALGDREYIFGSHRSHGEILAKGLEKTRIEHSEKVKAFKRLDLFRFGREGQASG